MPDSAEQIAASADQDKVINGVSEVTARHGENKFQQAIAAWRSLDLTRLVLSLDTTAEELVTHQKESIVQRKELAQKTKDFRKLDDAGKLIEIKDMLKAYQTYIDVLTNHSKSVSSAFMQAYSPLSDAPDPFPLLEASVESLVTADEVVPKLEQENSRLGKLLTKLTAQADGVEKQLEAERTKRQASNGLQDEKIKEVEQSWSAVLREKEDNWLVKEKSLEEKLESQERLLKEVKASYEVSQRLDQSNEDGQGTVRGGATAAELEFVNLELEKASSRLVEVEARNEQLRVEIAQSTSQAHSSKRSTSVEDDPAYLRIRSENSSLLRKLDSARHERDAEKSKVEAKLRSLDRETQKAKLEHEALQARVEKWKDYDEVKRELNMLRTIEFSTGDIADDDDDDDDDDDAETDRALPKSNGVDGGSKDGRLEQLLLARNKNLSDELTEMRVARNELNQKLATLQAELTSMTADLEQVRHLNATLENELQRTQNEASNAFETMSVAGTYTSRYPRSGYSSSRRGGVPSPTSSIIGGFDPSGPSNPTRTLDSLRGNDAVGPAAGILPMVTAQRDRFKKKVTELEQEVQKQYQTVSSLRSEVASLQKDNLDLYEKTRYVSSYNRSGHPAASGASYGANPDPSTVQVAVEPGSSGQSIDRYRSAYEQTLSPFAAFRGRESARTLKRMGLPERAVFQFTRMVLATRTSRNLFTAYCIGLHILVLAMLYWMGTADMKRHTSNPGASVAAGTGSLAISGERDSSHGGWRQEGFDARAS